MSDNLIATRLKELRSRRGVSQEAAAEGCGISRIALARYESGARTPTSEITAKLADYYGVTIDYLMGRDESAPQPAPKIDIMFRSSVPNYLDKLSPKNRALLEEMARKLFELQQQEEKK